MLFDILNSGFIFFSIYLIAAMSGLFAERSGTINLSINGGMIIGALVYLIMSYKMQHDSDLTINIGLMIAAMLAAVLGSMIITTLLSVGAINLKGDQVVIGTAINILAPVISLITLIAVVNKDTMDTNDMGGARFFSSKIWQNSSFINPYMATMFLAIGVIIFVGFLWFVLNKTRFGLRLRTAGENPNALAAGGVSVYKIRHMAMLISGGLAGLAGAIMAAFAPSISSYNSNVSGFGFIALAVMIIGQWRTQWLVLAGIAISMIFSLADNMGIKLGDNKPLLQIIPYLGTIVILPFVSKYSRMPQSEGIAYDKSKR